MDASLELNSSDYQDPGQHEPDRTIFEPGPDIGKRVSEAILANQAIDRPLSKKNARQLTFAHGAPGTRSQHVTRLSSKNSLLPNQRQHSRAQTAIGRPECHFLARDTGLRRAGTVLRRLRAKSAAHGILLPPKGIGGHAKGAVLLNADVVLPRQHKGLEISDMSICWSQLVSLLYKLLPASKARTLDLAIERLSSVSSVDYRGREKVLSVLSSRHTRN